MLDAIGLIRCHLQRAGLKGTSFTYFTTDNAKMARELVGILRESSSDVPPQLEEMAMFSGGGGRSKFQVSGLGSRYPTDVLISKVDMEAEAVVVEEVEVDMEGGEEAMVEVEVSGPHLACDSNVAGADHETDRLRRWTR
jgi:hypothetical protein